MMLSFAVAAEVTSPVLSTADAGMTPDSPFYFLDELFEQAGNDPEKALKYKEEKIAELEVMARQKKVEAAQKALENAQEYGGIVEKEVTPEMEVKVKQSVEITGQVLEEAGKDLPELRLEITEKKEQEQRINIAAEISTKIKQLCETLSKLDPHQYAQTCKTDTNAPQWQQKYDRELTEEQKKHAASFAEKMTQCFETQGEKCDCEGMGVKTFEELCIAHRDLKQRCDAGDKDACTAMIEKGSIDMMNYLPDYLHPVVQNSMKKFTQVQDEQYGEFEGRAEYLPMFCKSAGITSARECAQYMGEKNGEFFSNNGFEFKEEKFMDECLKYKSQDFCEEKAAMMKKGEFSSDNNQFGPGPCRDKGITSMEECRKYMDENFQKTPEGAYIIGPPARIGEFGRDCHAVQDFTEKARCFEDYYNQAQGQVSKPTLPASTTRTAMYPSGMEEWQRSYYERWLKATTEEERLKIKMEMTLEMNKRNQQNQQQYNVPPTTSAPVDWVSGYAQRWFSASDGYRNTVIDELRQDAARRGYTIEELETKDTSFTIKYKGQDGVTYENRYGSTAPREELPEINVEIQGNVAKVEISRDGYLKDSFTLSYSTGDQLVSELAMRLGLTKEEVERVLEIEIEEEDIVEDIGDEEGEADEPGSEEAEEGGDDIGEDGSSDSQETRRENANESMMINS